MMSMDAIRSVLILLGLLLTGCSSNSNNSPSPNGRIYCGPGLVDVLQFVCQGIYYEAPSAQKRLLEAVYGVFDTKGARCDALTYPNALSNGQKSRHVENGSWSETRML
ncbi:hypothetical protein CHUAL_012071 [Chamberlinius hualienensis]